MAMSMMDLRQALAGLLTLSMFIMLGNMIKKDHFDSYYYDVEIPATPVSSALTEQRLATVSHLSKRPWKENEEAGQSKGYIKFSLTNGPEYHISQIADAVVVARYLGATLVLPDIKSSKFGYSMNLGDVYDVESVIKRLDGLVRVTRTLPAQFSNGSPPIVRVPNRVSEDYILKKVKPIYKAKGIVKIESYFPSMNATLAGKRRSLDPVACKAMFGTLQLQSDIQEVAESVVQQLEAWSQNGQFIAVDLRAEVLGNECHRKDETGRKLCHQPKEIGEFLKKIGFSQDTAIYVTQNKWSSNLDALRDIFPKTYTKETVMSVAKTGKFLSSEFEKVIDFYICSQSDVFVPSIPGIFYANVAGLRIASGRNQILVPDEIARPSASAFDYMSPYVTQKSHFAYACFC
ncbi:GDP-fucose protein O-fucosyltransferase [Sesbania bispinosa]|nr:GDP-fucose protein O-fucosyltransferase [Sesbania bispinosa]